jgi:hypothetical protein
LAGATESSRRAGHTLLGDDQPNAHFHKIGGQHADQKNFDCR